MAKSVEFPFGKISGKLGNVVFYERNGKICVRKRPEKIGIAPSPKQLYHREAFAKVNSFLKPIRSELEFGFSSKEGDKSKRFAKAVSLGLKRAVFPEEGIPVLKPEKVMISIGDLTEPSGLSLNWMADNQLTILWQPNQFEGKATEGDRLLYLAYDPLGKRKWSILKGATRKSGIQEVEFPWTGPLQGQFYHYFAFHSKGRKYRDFSNSVCFGIF
ncbi:hypothetical protein IQ238_26660 [Pleurocapsales cyanobacterium LEGE 06147]|nr:hypothetical protein [Pleurocapsales cyanobacterium LEGE 06147]